MERYDIRKCIFIEYRGLASYKMPERKGIYLIAEIRRNFSIVDFYMKLDRRFIFRNMEINIGMKDLCDKILYMYEDTFFGAGKETNLIRKMEEGEISQKDFIEGK